MTNCKNMNRIGQNCASLDKIDQNQAKLNRIRPKSNMHLSFGQPLYEIFRQMILTRWNVMRFHVHWHKGFEPDYSRSTRGWQKKLRKWDSHWDFVDNLERFLCTNRDLNRWQNHQMSTWLAEDGARFRPFLKKKRKKMKFWGHKILVQWNQLEYFNHFQRNYIFGAL